MPDNKTLENELRPRFELREVGIVKSVREFIVMATGMPSCVNGQFVEFNSGVLGMVMGFKEDDVQVLVLGSQTSIHVGDEVYNKGQMAVIPVGEAFLGRMVNAMAEPMDGMGDIEPDGSLPLFCDAPGVMDRVPVDQTLETGTKILDAVIPIAKGQRQLLIGDRITGKTSVALDCILNQTGRNVVCVYCCIGKTYSNLLKVINLLKERDAFSYTVIVSGIASVPVGEQFIAPYTACAIGEYFMQRGRDVFVVFDDLTKHSWVYRQISLLLERAPGREAYPGDIFYIHSQLVERAGYMKPELGGGSMTFFPIVEILQGDVTGYISTNLISMTDGQIYFNTSLFNKGVRPPIDFGLSVSRIGNKAQWPIMKELSSKLRLEYLQYQELVQMTQLRAAGLSKEAESKLKRGAAMTELFVQGKNRPVVMEELVVHLYVLSRGILDELSLEELKKFKRSFFEYYKNMYPEILLKMREVRKMTQEIKESINTALKKYFAIE
ncbi:MAG TPA: F0F1 ATP synthase subunit alpha [Candidatus Omnitrophica bacterium]|nr:F0F1 ATP synthase subunit alpha [Candidatus Omnitrophota bacterium]